MDIAGSLNCFQRFGKLLYIVENCRVVLFELKTKRSLSSLIRKILVSFKKFFF